MEITAIGGGSGPNGNVRPNDTLSVTFTIKTKSGRQIPLSEVDFAGILASGPTFNYQPVLGYQGDVLTAAVTNADGSYTYTFPVPVPNVYQPPLNDTTAIGAADGELQGQPLLDGTYTVGVEAYKNYTVEGETIRDAGNATRDFLFGAASTLEARDVVTQANCNQCHTSLRAHGTIRRDVKHCLLCHTAGAEDKNEPTVAGGTPGTTIDFKVMIHKIHNGAHLPSRLGVTTEADGTRKYDSPEKRYQVVGFRNTVYDFSDIGFPVWPNLSDPLPADEGHTNLTTTQKSLEVKIRTGAATCAKCHGDPDGSGPLPAPAQGDRAFSVPSRAACGSCHDDVDWTKNYKSNLLNMPPQPDNSVCGRCHPADGGQLAVRTAHTHPLLDPARNAGLVIKIAAVTESGSHNSNGVLDPLETPRVKFTVEDGNGQPVDVGMLGRMEAVISGPITNRNILFEASLPVALGSGSSFDTALPQTRFLEYVGDAKAVASVFKTEGNHWLGGGLSTTVRVRTAGAPGASSTLASSTTLGQNFCDLQNSTGFKRGDYVVVDDGGAGEEYLRVQFVEGNRLWFSSTHSPYDQPNLRLAHVAGVSVDTVEFDTKSLGVDYALDPANGLIGELVPFGAGRAVVVSYTTDFVIPETFPPALNAEPALDETWGSWTGKPIVAGTYTVAIWGERSVNVKVGTETTSYVAPSEAAIAHFRVLTDGPVGDPGVISSANNCYSCHNDLKFHGGHRRGYATCIACHGTAGSADRPQYVAANAPPTTGVSIDFRRMLHKIHTGKDLANASTWTVVGFGLGYPNNFSEHTYEHVGFPSMLGGTKNCAACHGATSTAWTAPAPRMHPAQQSDTRVWAIACGSCHDSSTAQGHIVEQTSAQGAESCAVCHGAGREYGVDLVHKHR